MYMEAVNILLFIIVIGLAVLLFIIQKGKSALTAENLTLKAKLDAESIYWQQRLKDVEDIKQTQLLQFKEISSEIIRNQTAIFDENQQKALDMLLVPFKNDISEFKQKIEKVHTDNIAGKSSLDEQLKNLMQLNKSLSDDAQNLTEALKGKKKMQGDWGEFQLKNILELSGLEEGVSYNTQVNLKGLENNNLRPDVIVTMPHNRELIIDSKVSLNDYLDYIAEDNEILKKQHLDNYIKCLKNHIDELSDKDYQSYTKGNSLDYVMMFVPIESAYIEAIKSDSNLFGYAYKKKVAIATPSSLMVMLKIIENMWRTDKQNKSVQEVAATGALLYDKIAAFVNDMEKVGNSLDKASSSYDEAMKKLKTGKGNALKLTSRLKELGVKATKEIPADFEDDGDDVVKSDKKALTDV